MFINEAKTEIENYRKTGNEVSYRQACEKGCGAIAQAIMHVSGHDIYHHKEFSQVASKLKEKGMIDIVDAIAAGDKMHSAGFYHGILSEETVANAIQLIDTAIRQIKKL
jgi:methylmalonyl-CoA mutase cobalamin-binding subunit